MDINKRNYWISKKGYKYIGTFVPAINKKGERVLKMQWSSRIGNPIEYLACPINYGIFISAPDEMWYRKDGKRKSVWTQPSRYHNRPVLEYGKLGESHTQNGLKGYARIMRYQSRMKGNDHHNGIIDRIHDSRFGGGMVYVKRAELGTWTSNVTGKTKQVYEDVKVIETDDLKEYVNVQGYLPLGNTGNIHVGL
jgi:hypothetical protein